MALAVASFFAPSYLVTQLIEKVYTLFLIYVTFIMYGLLPGMRSEKKMYTLMITIEYISIAVLMFEIIYVMRQKGSYMQNLMLMLITSVLINLIGYLMELKATNMDTALMGVKVAYLGKPYIGLFIFFFVMEFCKVKLPALVNGMLIFLHVLITALVFTCQRHKLYYTSIKYIYTDSYSHLVLGHGIFYYIFLAMMIIYFMVIAILGVKKIRKTNDWLIKRQMLMCIIMVGISLGGFLLFLSGITGGYDATVVAYFICVQMLVLLMGRYQLFNTLSFARDDATDSLPQALMVFDNDDDIIYMNKNGRLVKEYIERNFEEPVYETLQSFNSEDRHLIVENGYIFKVNDEDYQMPYNIANSVYHVAGRDVIRKNRSYGHIFIVSDETDNFYYTNRLRTEVDTKTHEIVNMQRSVIGSFAAMIEARDGITGLHIKNTSNFVRILAHAMQSYPQYRDEITDEYVDMVTAAARLHDIGKISVPDYVLQKPGKLSEEEYDIMKMHPAEGARIIKETLGKLENDEYVYIAYDMAYYHHEKYAGGGYPCNLKGEEIPLSARIMAICDVYDALRSNRHYKKGFSVEKTINIIRESRGVHFDPDITDIFLENIDEMEAVFINNDRTVLFEDFACE